jgi:hypothetical protein
MNSEYDESIVQKFEAVGTAKNIKTIAQGRNVSLTNGYIDEEPLNIGMTNRFNLRVTCNTIINHPKTSEKQKQFAKKIFDINKCNMAELNIIKGIMKRYK